MRRQVFLDLLTHSFFSVSGAAVLVLDECHHAQGAGDHPYTRIMVDWYRRCPHLSHVANCQLPLLRQG